jgi:hypothetical protein
MNKHEPVTGIPWRTTAWEYWLFIFKLKLRMRLMWAIWILLMLSMVYSWVM